MAAEAGIMVGSTRNQAAKVQRGGGRKSRHPNKIQMSIDGSNGCWLSQKTSHEQTLVKRRIWQSRKHALEGKVDDWLLEPFADG